MNPRLFLYINPKEESITLGYTQMTDYKSIKIGSFFQKDYINLLTMTLCL